MLCIYDCALELYIGASEAICMHMQLVTCPFLKYGILIARSIYLFSVLPSATAARTTIAHTCDSK